MTGSTVHMTELSASLARLGHDVRVYTRRSSPAQPAQTTDATGITVVNVPIGEPRPPRPGEQLCHLDPFGRWLDRSWGDDWAPDVVHAHTWPSAVAALVAKKMTSRPTVVTLHGVAADPTPDDGQAGRAAAFRRRVALCAAAEADAVRWPCPTATLTACGTLAFRGRRCPSYRRAWTPHSSGPTGQPGPDAGRTGFSPSDSW
ncbi:glycosyltransferase [Micromonospora sp. CPCC 205371]|nr:glycosyltransferase [Micromonospora sp. CPCC 205371]